MMMQCSKCGRKFTEREAYKKPDPDDKNHIILFCPQCKVITGSASLELPDDITPLPSGNRDGMIVD